jgi:hypothetical protein
MCVISHSVRGILWSCISLYILGNGHSAVMWVISHSIGKMFWRHISAYIMGSGGFVAICVINHSFIEVIWTNISTYIVGTSFNVCNESFGRQDVLETNQRVHTGEWPFFYRV